LPKKAKSPDKIFTHSDLLTSCKSVFHHYNDYYDLKSCIYSAKAVLTLKEERV